MRQTFICLHCEGSFRRNPCLKKPQNYCSAKQCQQARRSTRKKERYKKDPVYRKKNLLSQKARRKRLRSDQYMQKYRESHPEYVRRNCELQKERNKNRQSDQVPMIVNGTSLLTQPSDDVVYAILKVQQDKMIVNGTSFMAQMQIISGKEVILSQKGV